MAMELSQAPTSNTNRTEAPAVWAKVSTTMLGFLEWKPQRDLTLRIEAQTFNQRNVKRIREVYLGSRADNRLDYTDVRDLEWGGSLFFRLRKSWG